MNKDRIKVNVAKVSSVALAVPTLEHRMILSSSDFGIFVPMSDDKY